MSEATQTPMVDHIQHFWNAISEPHVRILVDMRRDHDDGSFHWDSSSFGDDVAKALVGSRAGAPSARQYYYRVNKCDAPSPDHVSCICWHDEGAGPLKDEPEAIKSWRDKPAQSAAMTTEPVAWPAWNAKVEKAITVDGEIIGVSVILLVPTEDLGKLPNPYRHSAERVLAAPAPSHTTATSAEPVAWQPMETAPRNGTPIMMKGVTAGGSKWFMDGQVYAKGWIGGSAVGRYPSHWMPLLNFENATPPSSGNADALVKALSDIRELANGPGMPRSLLDQIFGIATKARRATLSSAPVAGEWQEALAQGFMTACSGDGEYQIKIGFETLKDMQAAHMALCKSAYAHSRNDRDTETERRT